MKRLLQFCFPMLTVALLLGPATSIRADETEAELQLERELLDHVRQLAERLREAGAENVGALKFSVTREGQTSAPSSTGRLNTRLAEKTEIALVFSSPRPSGNYGVLRNATDVAATIKGATHLEDNDLARQRLFSREYPLAWEKKDGSTTARPDAFVSGNAEIAEDLREITITLNAFLRDDLKPGLPGQTLCIKDASFTVPIDIDDLLASGESCLVSRSAVRRGGNWRDEAFASAVQGRKKPKEEHPLQSSDRPVSLQIRYDGKLQPLRFFRNGEANGVLEPGAYVNEPRQDAKVELEVSRRDPTDQTRYAVLLRVNGENTLLRQRKPDHHCGVWVLEPKEQKIVLRGFHLELGPEGKRAPFKVFGASQSLKLNEFYGRDIGLISVTVYQEKPKGAIDTRDPNRELALRTIEKGVLPEATAASKSILGKDLTSARSDPTKRGAIAPDETTEDARTKVVQFDRASEPIFSGVVRYYRPMN